MGGYLRDFNRAVCGFSLFFIFAVPQSNAQIGDPARDQEGRLLLADAWAPVIFQDMSMAVTREHGPQIDPSDAIVDLFFNDSENIRGNGEAIFRVGEQDWDRVFEQPSVYFSVIETQSHYYINYFLYHAVDTNTNWHVHDTENLWMIVKKNGSNFGELEGVVTNAHGRPMIYGTSYAMKAAAQRRRSNSLDRRFMKYLDRHSKEHSQGEGIEFVERSGSRSFKAFVASKSHAIYKFSSQAPVSNAVVYYSQSCSECFEDIKGYKNGVIGYQLKDFDLTMDHFLLSRPDQDVQESIFIRDDSDKVVSNSQYQDRGLPNYLAPGWTESEPSANLFFVTSFKTPYTLADPASVHSALVGPSRNISNDYVYNFYLEPVESEIVQADSPVLFKRASVWGIASMLFESQN